MSEQGSSTKLDIVESLRAAREEAWEEGWLAGAGWPQIEDNPYRRTT